LRLVVSHVAAFIVEGYAIAVMVLDQQVQQINASHKEGDAPIRYNAGRAKLNYLILVCLVVLFGHVLPELLGFPREIAILSLLPMLLISWYGYEMFSVNYTLRDRTLAKAKREEDDRLAKVTSDLAERGKTAAQAELLREQRLLEEAKARQREADAKEANAKVRLVREERLREEAKPVYEPVSPGNRQSYFPPQNGHSKPWDERSFAEIEIALQDGETPPRIEHLDTWQRYLRLRENYFEYGQQFDIKAAQLVGVNAVRFRKDLRLLAAHRLVKEVSRGVYVLVEPVSEGR
jgi:hypothetical protein